MAMLILQCLRNIIPPIVVNVLLPVSYCCQCRSLSSAINKDHVSSFFDRALSNVLAQVVSAGDDVSTVTQSSSPRASGPATIPNNLEAGSLTASKAALNSGSQTKTAKGFGSVARAPPSTTPSAPPSSPSSEIVSGKKRSRKVREPSAPKDSAILRAIAEKKSYDQASRAASLTMAQQMDSLLESLEPPSSASSQPSPLPSPTPVLRAGDADVFDLDDELTSQDIEGTSPAAFDSFILSQLDRLGALVASRSGAGPSVPPAISGPPAPQVIPRLPSPPAPNEALSMPALSAHDLMDDLEDLLAAEEAGSQLSSLSGAEETSVEPIALLGTAAFPANNDIETVKAAGLEIGIVDSLQSQQEVSNPLVASMGRSRVSMTPRAPDATTDPQNQASMAVRLAAAEAEAGHLAEALAAREAAALEAAGLAGSVIARLVASEALGASEKIFYTQALNRMLSVLMPPQK